MNRFACIAVLAMAGCREEPKVSTVRGVPLDLVHISGGAFRGTPFKCGAENVTWIETLDVPSFYIDRTLVTCSAYADCADAGKCRPLAAFRHESLGPVCAEGFAVVRWSDAADYCALKGGSVPTSVQWQRAIRGKDAMVRVSTDSVEDGEPCRHPTSIHDTDPRCRHVSPDGVEFVLKSRLMEHLRETSCPNRMNPGARTSTYAVLFNLLGAFEVTDYAQRAMFRCAYEAPAFTQP
jgi:Sulfatase-modifying factor enzyme 1